MTQMTDDPNDPCGYCADGEAGPEVSCRGHGRVRLLYLEPRAARVIGRRRPDGHVGQVPDDVQPGDYWRALIEWHGQEPSNLTGLCYYVVAPEPGFPVVLLTKHTIREHDDGTISVRPGDGSSNSILVHGAHGKVWHGYIEHGDWRQV